MNKFHVKVKSSETGDVAPGAHGTRGGGVCAPEGVGTPDSCSTLPPSTASPPRRPAEGPKGAPAASR